MTDSFSFPPKILGVRTLLYIPPPHILWPSFACMGKSLPGGDPPPASPHWSPLLRHPDLSGPSCCGNCRFDHSPHFVRLHHMQAPLIGNSGLPKARQPGDQGQLPHCLVYKLVPSWRSDHHQEAGNSEMEIGAACEKGGLPLQAYLRFMHPRLRVQGEGPP